ncbi:cobalamin biosynthesis protein CobG [Streptomyces sp. NPDC046203]|uniref:cobalamin biosynthesis protein CobG n=1 Tax=Streptomyces sp. NPDC046203 TaxID=3154602 RepID=UPI0034115BDE
MLAAMPPTPDTSPEPGEPPIRDRGDACPGALRLHAAADGSLARLRLPAGKLTQDQIELLASVSESLGDGAVSITSRGNVELRGLSDGSATTLADRLGRGGLLPSPTHERVRNIVASPAAGLDGTGRADVHAWARELDGLLCAEPRAAALSGRFLFVLDDGRGDVAGLGGDVTLIAEPGGASALLRVGGQVRRIAAGHAPRVALAAALAFLDAAETAGTGAWRVGELPAGAAEAVDLSGTGGQPVPVPPPLPSGPPPAPGPLGPRAVSVLAPLGRLTAAQLRALLPAAEVRLTPWRGAVVVTREQGAEPAPERTPELLARLDHLASAGLITRPDAPGAGVTACTGLPGCAKSLADVRADAARALAVPAGALPVHVAGCARRCGHPHGTWVDVLATGAGTEAGARAETGTATTEGGAYLVDGAPTPRTALPGAVATARTAPPAPTARAASPTPTR